MIKNGTLALSLTGLVASLAMGMAATTVEAKSSSSATRAAQAAVTAKHAQLKQKKMLARQSMMQRQAGMGMPSLGMPAMPVSLPSAIGACKLDLNRWQSTLNKMLKEEC